MRKFLLFFCFLFSFFLFLPKTYALPTNIEQCVTSAGGSGCQSGLRTFNVSQDIKFYYFSISFDDILTKGEMYHLKVTFFGDIKDGFYGYAPDLWQLLEIEYSEPPKEFNVELYNMTWTGDATSHYRTLEFDFIPRTNVESLILSIENSDGCLYWSYAGDSTFGATELEVTKKYSSGGDNSQGTQDIINNNNQNTNNIINNNNQNTDKIINNLTNNNVNDASNSAESFFQGFQSDTFGLTSVITAPLSFIGNITSSTCSPIVAPLPFVGTNLVLPCMSTIYNQYFGSFFSLYQSITFGVVAYWVVVRIFNLVKDFKNPEHDEIEVFDL